MSPQLWSAEAATSTTSATPHCSPFTIPHGIFIVNETFEVTITENALFKPQCTGGSSGLVHGGFADNSTVTDVRAPFYSSTIPQIFAIAVATVISYFLVILIFITPRTFFVGGPGGGASFLTRHGLSGKKSVVGVGRRPLLQKIAAVSVAISMTIATADTFKVAKSQYEDGYMNPEEMVKQVVGGLEIRIVQVISDTFLWFAQVQTLIRLFPRQKEKVTIKWLGFGLILLDAIFSILNNFLLTGTNARLHRSRDAIPAFSYLFELAIGFIYAPCVIYYALSKYRFAFYHVKMRSICLVALLSISSVLIPVVFFVIDMSSPSIATWGFYIRWVGAAAASVVVWEWVERIEALERDEKKDGILGWEVYDGDDMLDATTANGVDWPGRRSRRDSNQSDGSMNRSGLKGFIGVARRPLRARFPFQGRKKRNEAAGATNEDTEANERTAKPGVSTPAPPAAVATPISRADTTSAASTIYAVRYHNLHSTSPQVLEDESYPPVAAKERLNGSTSDHTVGREASEGDHSGLPAQPPTNARNMPRWHPLWAAVPNPFKRRRASPPAEVAGAQMLEENSQQRSAAAMANAEKFNLRSKIDTFTAVQRHRLRLRRQSGRAESPLPVTIIPAQPRGTRTWSPDDAAASNAAKHIPAHSNGEGAPAPSHSNTSDEGMNATVEPAPLRETADVV